MNQYSLSQLKKLIKDYKKQHCPSISKLTKSQLYDLSVKLGLTQTTPKVVTKTKTKGKQTKGTTIVAAPEPEPEPTPIVAKKKVKKSTILKPVETTQQIDPKLKFYAEMIALSRKAKNTANVERLTQEAKAYMQSGKAKN